MAILKRIGRVAAICFAATQLSGCVAAALPLMAIAGPAISGFVLYKSVQTVSGGSVDVSFSSRTPAPLSSVPRIAVWPGDEGNVRLAELLSSGGKTITSPSAVSTHISSEGLATNLQLMTETERTTAFAAVCRRAQVDLVLASLTGGVEANANFFSFDRANQTYRASLLAYSCAQRTLIWRDEISVVVGGGGRMPSSSEISQVTAQAWSERILEAMRTR